MKRNNIKAVLSTLCAAVLVAMTLTGCSCGGEDTDWVTGDAIGSSSPQSAQTTPSAATSAPTAADSGMSGSYAAPQFKSGVYEMVSTVINKEVYTDGTGATVYEASVMTRYTYRLDIAVGSDGIDCKYTFKSVYGTTDLGSQTVVGVNTQDASLMSDDTKVYYDIIGKSFTSRANAQGELQSVSGIDEIIKQVPAAAAILGNELMQSLAADLFYAMPTSFEQGTSWQLVQYGITNTCTVQRIFGSNFGIDIKGGTITPAAPTTDSEGYTTTYTETQPLSGTIWMDMTDRAVQEMSSQQKTSGTLTDPEGYGVYFALTASTNCKITKQEG